MYTVPQTWRIVWLDLFTSVSLQEQSLTFFRVLSSFSGVVSQPFFVSEPSTESLQMWANEDFFSRHGEEDFASAEGQVHLHRPRDSHCLRFDESTMWCFNERT